MVSQMKALTREELLTKATEIAEDYQRKGYSLTLRQLYYQCVATGIIPNADASYKRLGDVLGDARLAGDFDMDLIEDRGRDAGGSKQLDCDIDVNEALVKAASYVEAIPRWTISIDRWFGQPKYVSVWVEKDALSGVFQKPCESLGVGFFACKGYPSHSALWQWLKKLQDAYQRSFDLVVDDEGNEYQPEEIKEAVILYFGDHDPDGWQIPRSAEENLNIFARVHGLEVPPIRLVRLALNRDQIKKYNPPPFPAKPSSSRFKGYVKEHGLKQAWELDALKPDVLDKMVRTSVKGCWDEAIHQEWQDRARVCRARLRQKMAEPEWLTKALG